MPLRYENVVEAAEFLQSKIKTSPRVSLVLGTGLGAVAERVDPELVVPYGEIPDFPTTTVSGHQGRLVFGSLSGQSVVVMQGRFHYYEGYTLDQVTFPIRVMKLLGAEILMINSAAGGLRPSYASGDVMIIEDHINLLGQNPLRGLTDDRFGDRFPDMSRPYCSRLMELAESAAMAQGIRLHRGVYAGVSGPSLETRSETRMLKLLGADCVGMSTVPEAITAVQVGLRTMALAAITNVNIPDCMEMISLEQVLNNAKIAEGKISGIITEVIAKLD